MPKFTINIDFDEASRQWRIHTHADNPTALRKRQRQYWRDVRKAAGPTRRSTRGTTGVKRVGGTNTDPTWRVPKRTRTSSRRSLPPKRLIDEC